jgi:hypothetical protein
MKLSDILKEVQLIWLLRETSAIPWQGSKEFMLTAIVYDSDSLTCEVVAVCVMLTGWRLLSRI